MDLPLPWLLLSVAARTAIILLVILLGIRFLGKREVGDLELNDVVMVLLLSNAIQNAVTYGSGSLTVGLVSAATLLVMERLIGALFVSVPSLERRFYGEPTVILADGLFDRKAMRQEGVSEDEVRAAARNQGIPDLSQVRLAILEADGSISIIPRDE